MKSLIAGGLSFAGIGAAIGLSKLFIDGEFTSSNHLPNTDFSDAKETSLDADASSTESEIELAPETVEEDFDILNEVSETSYEEESYDSDYEYYITFDSNATFAHNVNDDMDFSNAFASAREDVGMGGFFNWRDNSYSTYTKEEWDAMSPEDQQRFFADVSEKTQLDTSEWTIESKPAGADADIEDPIEELNEADLEFEDESAAQSSITSSTEPIDEVSTITIVPPVAYGSADINSDNIVDAIVVDTNADGKADLLALDEDFDGTFESFRINDDGDEDLDVFIIDEGGDGVDDSDTIEEISDEIDMEDFIVMDADDEALEGLDFIDDLIDLEDDNDLEEDNSAPDTDFEMPGL